MWRTPLGNRCLSGHEASLFRAAVADLSNELRAAGSDYRTGVKGFDALSFGQRVAILEDVTAALLLEHVPPPLQTAASEAAIFAVYRYMMLMVRSELDAHDSPDFRGLIRRACFELGLRALAEEDDDEGAWDDSIDSLNEQVLWDHDFADEDLYLDSPRQDQALRPGGIHEDYFTDVPRDLKDNELASSFANLKRLTQPPG